MADSSHFDANVVTSTDSTGASAISVVQSNVTESSRVDSVITTGGKGDKGDTGATGAGVAAGGTSGQFLSKTSSTDYATGWSTIDKNTVGLGNVDNTSDAAKPLSTAATTALAGKEPTLTAGTTSQYYRGDKTWQTLDKTVVGLANVDNTADVDKPISTATASALSGKEPTISAGIASQYWRGDKTWQTLDKSAVGLSNVDNTSDLSKPISTATQAALDLKVSGAVSATDNAITRFDGVSGELVQNSSAFLDDSGFIGLGTSAPTHPLTLNSTSTGIALHNQTDQVTNFERGRIYWTSNVFTINSDAAGTGTTRPLDLISGNSSLRVNDATRGLLLTRATPSTVGTLFEVTTSGTGLSLSSGTQYGLKITPTVNQSSTAGYTGLYMNITETATGSGGKSLIDLQVGGASRMWVTNSGTINTGSVSGGIAAYNTADAGTNYERIRTFWSSGVATITTENGGTGTIRNLSIGTFNRRLTFSETPVTAGIFQFGIGTATIGVTGVNLNGNITQASSTYTVMAIQPNVQQTVSAGYTALLVNPTETTVGTGAKYLADFQIGGVTKTRIDNTGALQLSTGVSQYSYNLGDETQANYERLRQYWTGNAYTMITEAGGTGTLRSITINGAASFITLNGTNITMGRGGTGNSNIVTHQATFTASSGTQVLTYINPTLTQTSTAGYTAFRINPTETTVGSGTKYLLDVGKGGGSYYSIDNVGTLIHHSTGASVGALFYNTADETTNFERLRMYFLSNQFRIQSEVGGTGTMRDIVISNASNTWTLGNSTSAYTFQRATTAIQQLVQITSPGLTGTSMQYALVLDPTINQSGTGGYTMLRVNPTETALGSGNKYLADFAVGGASKVRVTNGGSVQAVNFANGSAARTGAVTLSVNSSNFNPCDATTGAFTVTLPSASSAAGYFYIVKKTDASANAVTVATGGGNIDGAATYTLTTQYKYVVCQSDGTNWFVIANN